MSDFWYTRPELARKLRVSEKTIQRRIKPTVVIGRQNRYLMSDVRAQLSQGNVVQLRPQGKVAA